MTKLNKQGVRDLSDLNPRVGSGGNERGIDRAFPPLPPEQRETREFGKHQLPGELAAKLLSEQPAEFGAPLDPQSEEFLQILAEECAETVQRVTKILRFGLRRNPWDGKDNIERLESEIGDICAVLDVLTLLGVIDEDRVAAHQDRKRQAFAIEENSARPRIRHMTPELRALILSVYRNTETP